MSNTRTGTCPDCGAACERLMRSRLWEAVCCPRCYNTRYQRYRRQPAMRLSAAQADRLAGRLLRSLAGSPLGGIWQAMSSDAQRAMRAQWADLLQTGAARLRLAPPSSPDEIQRAQTRQRAADRMRRQWRGLPKHGGTPV